MTKTIKSPSLSTPDAIKRTLQRHNFRRFLPPRLILLLFTISLLGGMPSVILAHSSERKVDVILHMSPTGYEPRNVIIKPGQTVGYENSSSTKLWPASNIHPTHEIYPEFDSKSPVIPGDMWTFTFMQPGIWQYHDHLFPQISGSITVQGDQITDDQLSQTRTTSSTGFIQKILNFFRNIFNRTLNRSSPDPPNVEVQSPSHPYDDTITEDTTTIFSDEAALYSHVKKFGPASTMSNLHGLSAQFGDCHNNAHLTGRFSYDLYGQDAFRRCSAECHSGCYHGATESFFRDYGTENLQQSLALICQADRNTFFDHQCLHGIGHGLMAWANYEIHEALAACDLLERGKDSCYTGVFMENIVGTLGEADTDGHFTRYLSEDPHFPCNVVDERYQASCYFYQTSRMVQLFNGDFSKVAATCAEAPARFHRRCFESMGRDIGGTHRLNPTQAIVQCNYVATVQNRQACLNGAVQDTFWDPVGQDAALAFCRQLNQSSEKEGCYNTIFSRAPLILESTTDRKTFCVNVEPAYRQRCSDIILNS